MPIAPLFISDRPTLISKLRMSGSHSASDAQALIDEAIQKVRISFYDALGATKVVELLATPFVENAVTAESILRAKANSVEVAWVKSHLLRDLPTLFIDGSAIVQQTWNQEGFTRNISQNAVKEELRRLEEYINDAIADLKGGTPDLSTISVSVIEPDETPALPGATVWGS